MRVSSTRLEQLLNVPGPVLRPELTDGEYMGLQSTFIGLDYGWLYDSYSWEGARRNRVSQRLLSLRDPEYNWTNIVYSEASCGWKIHVGGVELEMVFDTPWEALCTWKLVSEKEGSRNEGRRI